MGPSEMSIGLRCIKVRSESRNPRASPIVFHSAAAAFIMKVSMCRSCAVRQPNNVVSNTFSYSISSISGKCMWCGGAFYSINTPICIQSWINDAFLCITIVRTYLQAAEVRSIEIVATSVMVELGMSCAADQWAVKLSAAL